MKKPPSTPAPAVDADPRRAWLRLGALAFGILAALLIVATATGLSASGVRDWVDQFGAAAPLVFIVVSASLTCALFPGPVLAAASGLLFGTAVGFPVSLAGDRHRRGRAGRDGAGRPRAAAPRGQTSWL